MAHRQHLFSLKLGFAIRQALKELTFNRKTVSGDLLSGITVGIIAIPLSMALAIAAGVAPQYGLYSAIVGGAIIALLGGSRYSVSGPTAAFIVILFPIVSKYGLSGLLIATMLGGVIQVIMSLMKLGRLIEYIPSSVTLGFTSGIAVVIATLQVKDFIGLTHAHYPESYLGKIHFLIETLPKFSPETLCVGVATLSVMLLWHKLKVSIPAHLPAVIVGTMVAMMFNQNGDVVSTINSTFNYVTQTGESGVGIPKELPTIDLPWLSAGFDLPMNKQVFGELLSAGFAIAMLGAIESLLCAVVLDGMTGKRHSANSELLGQGIGNIVTPLFGGITVTAAIARSAANYKSGAKSPISAVIHSMVVLLGIVLLSDFLGYVPMSCMAALLLVVAWNMSEFHKAKDLILHSPLEDVLVFFVCFLLTVFFDMVLAITVGTVLASILFMKTMASMTKVKDATSRLDPYQTSSFNQHKIFEIDGPLFYAAADRVFLEIAMSSDDLKGVVLDLSRVSFLDAGGVSALKSFVEKCAENRTHVYISDVQFQVLKALAKAKFKPGSETCSMHPSLDKAIADIIHLQSTHSSVGEL